MTDPIASFFYCQSQTGEGHTGIVNYFSHSDSTKLKFESEASGKRRDELKLRQKMLRDELTSALRYEYDDLLVGGEGTAPSSAARLLAEWNGVHDWIPSPVDEGAAFPMPQSDLAELYASNEIIASGDEVLLRSSLPDIQKIPTLETFTEFCLESKEIRSFNPGHGSEYWLHAVQETSKFPAVMDLTLNSIADLSAEEPWRLECIEAGRSGGTKRAAWDEFVDLIFKSSEEIEKNYAKVLSVGPKIGSSKPDLELRQICDDILYRVRLGGGVGFLSKLLKPNWREFLETSQVDSGRPETVEHFEALYAYLDIRCLREQIRRRWERQMTVLGAHDVAHLGEKPEVIATYYAKIAKNLLSWHETKWIPVEKKLQDLGLSWEKVQLQVKQADTPYGELLKIRTVALDHLSGILNSRRAALQGEENKKIKNRWLQELHAVDDRSPAFQLIKGLHDAVVNEDFERYKVAWSKLNGLVRLNSAFSRRTVLLSQLASKAPAWAEAIRTRRKPHDSAVIPGEPVKAWKYTQWSAILSRRNQVDLDLLQRELTKVGESLREATGTYVESLAWLAQSSRMGLRQQQALNGWLQIQRSIGKGTGIRVPKLRNEAKRLIAECKSSVPVWIMPLSRVMETFDISTTKFDVLIIDEASQSDLRGIAAFAMANEVIVVGDDEQVSPYAVGQDLQQIQALIDEHLKGVPNSVLYTGKTSVYDLAKQAFGGVIRLIEHFRCVPDIIQFSNHLCYSGEIKPLREAISSPFLPHVVLHRVDGGVSVNKRNEKEALEVASLIAAVCDLPEYEGASLGAVSLVGEDQALMIGEILQKRLSAEVIQKRRILCGNASQFQGDERNVMFLSMVDSGSSDGPLYMRQTPEFTRSYNVAASRAQDQMWVVHSLNPNTDLKGGDLRLRLIQYAQDPKSLSIQIENATNRADSEFEKMVLIELGQAGFRVVSQWEVGAFRIDIVVIGQDGNKVAIECDGDRYHPPEKLPEDMERQMILERLGWRFIRIRGSEFFRDRKQTMKRVNSRLAELEVTPLGVVPVGPVASEGDDLRLRVIRKAEEIRKRWEDEPIDAGQNETKPSKQRRRWGAKAKPEVEPATSTTVAPALMSVPDDKPKEVVPSSGGELKPTPEVCQKLLNWAAATNKMVTTPDIIYLGAAKTVVYLAGRGRSADAETLKKVNAGLKRAALLGFEDR